MYRHVERAETVLKYQYPPVNVFTKLYKSYSSETPRKNDFLFSGLSPGL